MGIAEIEKTHSFESLEMKSLRTRQRAFLKRRTAQFGNCHLPSSWSLCTDLQRQWSRRRLRRLFPTEKHVAKAHLNHSDLRHRTLNFFWYTLLPLFLVCCFSCCITYYQNTDAVNSFLQRYTQQYQAIVHNKNDYCERTLPVRGIFEHIHSNVVNQDVALQRLEHTLANQSSFQSIALVGTSGVGKSLTLHSLQEKYPWKENIQYMAWNSYEFIDIQLRYKTINGMLSNLVHCGRNLIMIDNIPISDWEFVGAINKMVSNSNDVAIGHNDPDKKHLTIIYVFNVNGMDVSENYSQQLTNLQKMLATTVITYRTFDSSDLERCIRHEAHQVKMKLSENHIEEMISTTNVNYSGCKMVFGKVLIYGSPETSEEEEEPDNS